MTKSPVPPRVGLWEWNLDADHVQWSAEVLELFGVEPSDFGGSFSEVESRVHPDDRPRWREDVRRCLEEGVPHRINLRVLLPGGHVRWIEIYGNADRDATGRPTRLLGVAMDLTEHRRVESEMRTQTERFRSLMEHTAEGFYMFDIDPPVPTSLPTREQVDRFYDCRIVEANDALARMYGFSSGKDMLGMTLEQLHGSRDDPTNVEFLSTLVENGYVIRDTLSCETNTEGDAVWFSNNVIGIVEHGLLVRVWGSQTDVTQVLAARSELKQERHLSDAIIDGLPGIFCQMTTDGRLLRWNRAMVSTWGGPEDRLPGLDPRALVSVESREALVPHVRGLFETGEAEADVDLLTWDGRCIPHHVRSRLLSYAGESSVVVAGVDISARRQMEAERERLRLQLEQSSRLESVGRLAGGVAHDLNNLLAPILGFAELLQEEPDRDERRGHAGAIVQAALRARDLIAQLLAFGRRQPLEMATIDLNRVVREFEPLLRRTVREDVDFDLDLQSDLVPIRADANQMGQVLVNVVVNGTQAMPNGGRLRVRTRTVVLGPDDGPRGLGPGVYGTLEVQDTGMGMDPATASRVFEPFFTTKGEGGTGLGLATVYGIVKQHGGEAWVDSALGEGTTFRFFFPATTNLDVAVPAPERNVPRHRGRERILVVEDDAQIRAVLEALLRRQGHDVLCATDGEAALDLLRSRSDVDLVISDVVMPRMGGRELGERVAAEHPRVRMLYMSGYADEVVWDSARGSLLRKPFSSNELLSRVRATLDDGPEPATFVG